MNLPKRKKIHSGNSVESLNASIQDLMTRFSLLIQRPVFIIHNLFQRLASHKFTFTNLVGQLSNKRYTMYFHYNRPFSITNFLDVPL